MKEIKEIFETSSHEMRNFETIVALQVRGLEVLPSYDGGKPEFPFVSHEEAGVRSEYRPGGRVLAPINPGETEYRPVENDYSLFYRHAIGPAKVFRKARGVWENDVLRVYPEGSDEVIVIDLPTKQTYGQNLLYEAQKLIAGDPVLGLFLASVEVDPEELRKNKELPRVASDTIIVPAIGLAIDPVMQHLVAAEVYLSDKGIGKAFTATLCNNKVSSLRISGIPDEYTIVVETPKKKYSAVHRQIGETNTGSACYISPYATDSSQGFCYVLKEQGMSNDEFTNQILVRLQNWMNVPIEAGWMDELLNTAIDRGVVRECLVYGSFVTCLYVSLSQDEWIAIVNDLVSCGGIKFNFNAGSLPEIEIEEKQNKEEPEQDNKEEEELPIWPD